MKRYKYVEPDKDFKPIEIIVTKQDIIDNYFPYWKEQMLLRDKRDLITIERCIEDFIIVNWAEEL